MNAHVNSRVYGGSQATQADLDAFSNVAQLLSNQSTAAQKIAASWFSLGIQLQQGRQRAPFCPKVNAANALTANDCVATPNAPVIRHVSLNYASVQQHIDARQQEFTELATRLEHMADHLIRAYSLYSQAEHTAARLFGEGLQAATVYRPDITLKGFALLTLAGTIYGSIQERRFNPSYALTSTWWMHEGVLAGIATHLNAWWSGSGTALGDKSGSDRAEASGSSQRASGSMSSPRLFLMAQGLLTRNEVNQACEPIGLGAALWKAINAGDVVTVKEINPSKGIQGTSTIADSLRNVHDMRLNKVDYGSIAIQQYRREDGQTAWMVTIPGTDGHVDSPFNWPTNTELMSSNSQQRQYADSARMVDEAMRQAGIGKNDPVAIVGHSQGGIVAATIASDFKDRYNVEHIVTAGSPVANHPVGDTWVTSIEMNDELVSSLDGSHNPMTDTWLTVRGYSAPIGSRDGTAVDNTDDHKFITHDMNYMKAAWKDAEQLGNPGIASHEAHFQRTIDGTLVSTRYYRGRLSHLPTEGGE